MAGGSLYNYCRQAIARIVVVPFGARRILQSWLTLDDFDDLFTVDVIAVVQSATGQHHQVEEFSVAGRMGKQVSNGDGLAKVRQFWNVFT